jgi:hypothetical protein
MSSSDAHQSDPPGKLDPLFRHARREAIMSLVVFAICFVWSIGVYLTMGLHSGEIGEVDTVLGIPAWVFWGVAVPWLAADVFIVVFCFVLMTDDDLGEVQDGADLEEQIHPHSGDAETAG